METSKRLTVSVIIPTKNRPDDLELTVRSLMMQTVIPEQLIIVDQSTDLESKKRTDSLLAVRSASESRVALHYVRNVEISSGAVARNFGMSLASGDIWLYLDDDVSLEKDFIEQLLSAYRTNPEATGVSGIVTNYRPLPWAFRIWDWVFARGPFRDRRLSIYANAEHLRQSAPIPIDRFTGAMMSFRASAVRDHFFDENLRGVSDGEDVDFCVRLGQDGLLLIAPQARLEHRRSPGGRSQQHWLNRHASSNHFLYRKNWENKRSNWFHFTWLNAGYCLVATLASLRTMSTRPWRDLVEGIRKGNGVGRNRSSETPQSNLAGPDKQEEMINS